MPDSLDMFFSEVRDSCTIHAKRKGYTNSGPDEGNVLGPVLDAAGVIVDHGIGEIITKLLEYRVTHKKLLLVKIAGWAYTLWKRNDLHNIQGEIVDLPPYATMGTELLGIKDIDKPKNL